MATEYPITLDQATDQTVAIRIARTDPTDDLTTVTGLLLLLLDDRCRDDSDATLTLSTTDASQMLILTQTVDTITAEAYVPAGATAEPYPRWYRVYATAGAAKRIALYGLATITDI